MELNGNIKDTLTGFISALADGAGTIAYSNDGIANAMYQFTVTPSTGTMAVSLSSYRLFISGTSLVVSNGSTQVYFRHYHYVVVPYSVRIAFFCIRNPVGSFVVLLHIGPSIFRSSNNIARRSSIFLGLQGVFIEQCRGPSDFIHDLRSIKYSLHPITCVYCV